MNHLECVDLTIGQAVARTARLQDLIKRLQEFRADLAREPLVLSGVPSADKTSLPALFVDTLRQAIRELTNGSPTTPFKRADVETHLRSKHAGAPNVTLALENETCSLYLLDMVDRGELASKGHGSDRVFTVKALVARRRQKIKVRVPRGTARKKRAQYKKRAAEPAAGAPRLPGPGARRMQGDTAKFADTLRLAIRELTKNVDRFQRVDVETHLRTNHAGAPNVTRALENGTCSVYLIDMVNRGELSSKGQGFERVFTVKALKLPAAEHAKANYETIRKGITVPRDPDIETESRPGDE